MWNSKQPYKSSVVDSASGRTSLTGSPFSPLATRQRSLNSPVMNSPQQRLAGTPDRRRANNNSILGGTGPLLSSPFMPQIKRALGLEPNLQHKYGDQRRHSFGLTSLTVTSPSLPHVKLNRTRRLSLTEKNTSMIKRSSTVKIAPPVMGKVASPSLYHLRCNTSTVENRDTPDTYAVISALKDRRKRSVNVMEETVDSNNTQQAKRRRQESQHSNASTSSMPSMPEHFPELTSVDFSMRIDSPGIKRPSRPSQADDEDWHQGEDAKRQKCLNKNNSILSSLSSSQRFIQNQKRKTDSSFIEKENASSYGTKIARGEPPRLTHLDMSFESSPRPHPATTLSTESSTNQSIPTVSNNTDSQALKSQDSNVAVTTANKLPSMKKTASIYSGLGSSTSFKKVQYANVVATLDDYDSDREVEQQRVKQMLKDLDDSFEKKQVKTEETISTATSLTTTTMVSVVTTSVTIATPVTSTTTSTTSVLSVLEKLSKSPVQETGAPGIKPSLTVKPGFGTLGGTSLTGIGGLSATGSTLPTVTGNQSVSSAATTSTSAPGGFTFTTDKPAQSLSGLLASTSAATTSSATVSAGLTTGTGGFNFNSTSSTPATSTLTAGFAAPVVSTSTATPAAAAGGFTFGASVGGTTAPTAATTAAVTPGFSFGASAPASSSQPAPASSGLTTTQAPTGITGISAPAAASSAPSTGGFSFGLNSSTSSATAQPATQTTSAMSGFSFGAGISTGTPSAANPLTNPQSTAISTVPGSTSTPFNFGGQSSSTAATPGFSFGAGSAGQTSTTAPAAGFPFGATSTSTAAAPATSGFSFGAGPKTTTASATSAAGFSFGAAATTTTAAPSFTFGAGTTSTAASSGGTGLFQTGTATTTSASPFAFGSTNTSSTNPPPAYGSTNQPPAFGSTNQTPAFGAANTTPAFGSTNPAPAFGSTNQTSVFGSTNQASAFGSTNQTPAFGSTNQTPAFGSTNQTPAFGSTNQTPAFGSTNQTPAFGSANQAPAFGSANQPPAFGSTNQTPAFGSSNPAPAFGSTGQTFGAATTEKSNTPVFGATSNTASAPAFGAPTGFGKSQSMPVFNTNNSDSSNNASTFNFGGAAPNVNPFGQGQTTPAKQTGAAFGQISTDSTPKAQTGAMFQFGQSNNTSSVAKGFDFSSSSTPAANTGGFNFMASNSVPVFNFGAKDTPTATPTFGGAPGATPGFSLGAGGESSSRATRPKARGRRTARK